MPSEALLQPEELLPANDSGIDPPIGASEEATFLATASCDMRDLVDAPCRSLEVEYKSWRNLDHAEDRAELARDIAALANHGGGHIVFGFHEATLAPEEIDPFRTHCSTEQVAAAVARYLDPPVHCEVATIRAASGRLHAVVRVPGHGVVPICARQDGPLVGRSRLIERGAYYVRRYGGPLSGRAIAMPRPESARIEAPQDWLPLIRRCVRQDRDALLAMIDAAIQPRDAPAPVSERLALWHRAAHDAFLPLTALSPVAPSLSRRHYVLSYGFELVGQETLDHVQLAELLRRAAFEVRTMFRGGLAMFDPPYRRAVQARFATDPATGDEETDFLEVAWLRDRPPSETADFWRVSPRGFASIARDYAEDRLADNERLGLEPGTWFSPNVLAGELGELVWHAKALARFFSGVRRVCFRCEWWGLKGRSLYDPEGHWAHRGANEDDKRLVTLMVPAASLGQAWPEAVARMMAPVLRAFEPDLALGPDWVRAQAAHWRDGATD